MRKTGVRISVSCAVVPNSTESVETTLSFAINPVRRAVDTSPSLPNPSRPKNRGETAGDNGENAVLGVLHDIEMRSKGL